MSTNTSIESVILNNQTIATHPKLMAFVEEYQAALDGGYDPDPTLLTEMFVVLVEIAPEEPELEAALLELETAIVEEVVVRDDDLANNTALSDMLGFYVSMIEAGYEPSDATADAISTSLEGITTTDPALQNAIDNALSELADPVLADPYNTWISGTTGGARVFSIAQDGTISQTGFLANNGGFGYGVATGDINGDGHDDVLMSGDWSGAVIYYGDGAGGFTNSGENFPGWFQSQVAIADIDNDGDGDLYIHNGRGETQIWRNDPGGFTKTFTHDVNVSGSIYKTAGKGIFEDVNGDGYVDLLMNINNEGHLASDELYLNDGSGNFSGAPILLPPTAGYGNVSLSDVNGDGHVDYVRGTATGIEAMLNDGNGNFAAPGTDITGTFHGSVALADFDGDGHMDAVKFNPQATDGLGLWLGDGTDEFVFDKTLVAEVPGDTEGWGGDINVGDFSGDGVADIMYTRVDGGVGTIVTLINDGAGNFTEADTLAPGGYIFDGDLALI